MRSEPIHMIGLTQEQELDRKNFIKNFNASWYFDAVHSVDVKEHVESCTRNNVKLWPRDEHLSWQNPTIYFYLDFLMRENPELVYDIGCANQIIKKVFKHKTNIIGIDPNGNNADQKITFAEFAKDNRNKVRYAFAINSLHYISITNFAFELIKFFSIFEKNGIGFVTFNIIRLIQHTQDDVVKKLFGSNIDESNWKLAYDYVEKELSNVMEKFSDKVDFILVEMLPEYYNNRMEGNVRVIFKIKEPV